MLLRLALAVGLTLAMLGAIIGTFAEWHGWTRAETVAFRATIVGALLVCAAVLVGVWWYLVLAAA